MRTVTCTIAGLLATAFLIYMTPREHFTPKGIALPAQNARAPISPKNVVMVLDQSLQTNNFMVLGQVRAEVSCKTDDENNKTSEALLAKARSLAASLGANTIVVNVIAPAGIPDTLTLIGTAVYVPRQTQGAQS